MVRSHGSTVRSPSRSPTRRAPTRTAPRRALSTASTRYELDLDALGPDSTGLESVDNHGNVAGHLDVVRSDDIEGPEDFTMNMEYWMKTPLPLLTKQPEVRIEEATEELDYVTPEGDRAISNIYDEDEQDVQSQARRDQHSDGEGEQPTGLEESTMEHDEKVMSYLDALPDTDMDDAAVSTPHYKAGTLRRQRPHEQPPHAQSPSLAPPKPRSLQPTVEDSTDTPRKITQETVIHYQSEAERDAANESILRDMAELESQLKNQKSTAQARITELQTILSHTRSELEASRHQSYKQSDEIKELTEVNEMLEQSVRASSADTTTRLEAQREEHEKTIRDLNSEHDKESARQVEAVNAAWQQKMTEESEIQGKTAKEEWTRKEKQIRGEYEGQWKRLEEEKERLKKDLLTRHQQTTGVQQELAQSRNETSADMAKVIEEQKVQFAGAKTELTEKITTLESRIEKLISDLKAATDDATKSRLETNEYSTLQESSRIQATRITDLESRLSALQIQLDSSRSDVAAKDQEIMRGITEQERVEKHFRDSLTRISDLENSVSTLRKDLTHSRTETDDARMEIQRAHEGARVVRESLREARAETEFRANALETEIRTLKIINRDVERMLTNVKDEQASLVSGQKSQVSEIRTKAEDALRKVGALLEAERMEKKKAVKETKMLRLECDQLRAEANDKKPGVQGTRSDSPDGVYSTMAMSELDSLREIIRKQKESTKAAKAEAHAAREELENLRAEMEAQNDGLETLNFDMNERFADLLQPLFNEKAKRALEKRDDKWMESLAELKAERDLLAEVVMREWGRQECGRAKKGEKQRYHYLFLEKAKEMEMEEERDREKERRRSALKKRKSLVA